MLPMELVLGEQLCPGVKCAFVRACKHIRANLACLYAFFQNNYILRGAGGETSKQSFIRKKCVVYFKDTSFLVKHELLSLLSVFLHSKRMHILFYSIIELCIIYYE